MPTKNNTTFRFGYSFMIAENSYAKSGLPFQGVIVAESKENANEKVCGIAKEIANNLFKHQENFHFVDWELMENKPQITMVIPHNLSVVKLEVHLDYIIEEWDDSHNKTLRDAINRMWADNSTYERMKTIVGAYWERDKEELANRYDNECVWWHVDHLSFADVCDYVGYESVADELFNHIFDNEDLKAIINYVRPMGWEELV